MVRPRALIFGRTEGAPYHPLAAVANELESIFSKDFETRVSDRGEDLLALGLGKFDLVVGLDDRWAEEPQDQRRLDAVESWLKAGGALLLVHNGICWARDPRWRRLAGGRFIGHADARELTFVRPSGEKFVLFEEPYRFSVPWLSGNKVLARYEDGGRLRPAFWTRRVGKGRLGYALPGHGVDAYRHPDYRRWLADLALTIV